MEEKCDRFKNTTNLKATQNYVNFADINFEIHNNNDEDVKIKIEFHKDNISNKTKTMVDWILIIQNII